MDPLVQQPQQAPQTPFQAPPSPVTSSPAQYAPEHKKVGPIVAILVIVLVLVIGALYLLASRVDQEQIPADSSVASSDMSIVQSPSSNNYAQQPTTVQPVSNNSDDVASLEADLSTSASGLDDQNF